MILRELQRQDLQTYRQQAHLRSVAWLNHPAPVQLSGSATVFEHEAACFEKFEEALRPWLASAREAEKKSWIQEWEETFGVKLGSPEEQEHSRQVIEHMRQSTQLTPAQARQAEFDRWLTAGGAKPRG